MCIRDRYQIGEEVFSEGAPADAAFYIQSGKVQLTAKSEDGELTVITVLPDGSFLGESCLTDQSVRSSTANALESSTIVRIEKQAMLELFHSDPEFASRFLISVVSRSICMEEEPVSYTHLDVYKRQMLRRFFQDYKMLEGKAVEVDEVLPPSEAYPVIEAALAAYSKQRRKGFAAK